MWLCTWLGIPPREFEANRILAHFAGEAGREWMPQLTHSPLQIPDAAKKPRRKDEPRFVAGLFTKSLSGDERRLESGFSSSELS